MRRALIQNYNWVVSHAPTRRRQMGPLTLADALREAQYQEGQAGVAMRCAEYDGDYEAYSDLRDELEYWRARVVELEGDVGRRSQRG